MDLLGILGQESRIYTVNIDMLSLSMCIIKLIIFCDNKMMKYFHL